MSRRALLWLSAVAVVVAVVVVVAYQVVKSSAGERVDDFAARADIPTVQPGADVLAETTVVSARVHR